MIWHSKWCKCISKYNIAHVFGEFVVVCNFLLTHQANVYLDMKLSRAKMIYRYVPVCLS